MDDLDINDNKEPPDNIRNINIFPDLDDLMMKDDDIFIRRNVVSGAYRNVDHYADVIFRLTREDFMRPLREGVQNHVTEKQGRITEVHYYKGRI